MVGFRGDWRLRVVRNNADWPQRIVVIGSSRQVIAGRVGTTAVISGPAWELTVEHDDGGGWRPNDAVVPGASGHVEGRPVRMVVSKDRYHPGDREPDDLVLMLEHLPGVPAAREGGSMFDLTDAPFGAGAPSLRPLPDGAVNGAHGPQQLLGVRIRNVGAEPFADNLVLEVSERGRAELAACGVAVLDRWPPALLRATGQELFAGGVAVPSLRIGEQATVYFALDATNSRTAQPTVEFLLGKAHGLTGPVSVLDRGCGPALVADAAAGLSGSGLPELLPVLTPAALVRERYVGVAAVFSTAAQHRTAQRGTTAHR